MTRRLTTIITIVLHILFSNSLHADGGESIITEHEATVEVEDVHREADRIVLRNGDRITGEIISMEENMLKVKTFYAGKIMIQWEDVASIVAQKPLSVEIREKEHDSVTDDFPTIMRLTVNSLTGKEGIPLERVERINVPKYRYTGTTDIGGNRTEGNTDTTAFNASAETTIWSRRHRLDLSGKYAFSQADGIDTANNARGTLRYDYFLTKRLFVTASEFLEQDQLQELDLRSTSGVGIGYQVIDTPVHRLSGYIGPAFVYEQFRQSQATKTSTFTWDIEWEFELFTDHLRAFHKQAGFRDVAGDRNDALRWIAEQGLRITLHADLYLKLAYDFRFNSDPAPGRKKSDQAFIWGVGYQFSN